MDMNKKKSRDDFDRKVVDTLAKRASYICSNPQCRCLTIAAAKLDEEEFTYIGVAAHITAAAEGGPRHDKTLTSSERSSIENGILLCGSCSIMIDKNNGLDYSIEQLKKWKDEHHQWVQENLNKKILDSPSTVINVTSYNQSGGITAKEVNINTDRQIDRTVGKALIGILQSENCQITVGALGMGGEPDQLANQLLSAAQNAGCITNGVNHGVGFQPFKGIQIQVSQKNPLMNTAQKLESILNGAGIHSTVVYGPSLAEGSIYLYVGYKP